MATQSYQNRNRFKTTIELHANLDEHPVIMTTVRS
jgi:hypothetical protein